MMAISRQSLQLCQKKMLEKAATELDNERSFGTIRGPLHGIPFFVKVLLHALIFYAEYQILQD